MLKKIVPMAVLAASVLSTGIATAGYRGSYPVTIDMVNHRASGSTGTARNSADGNQYIQCNVQAGYASNNIVYAPNVTCSVEDASGTYAMCNTSEATFVDAVKTMYTGDSYVSFNWTGGLCLGITVYNGSQFEPKK